MISIFVLAISLLHNLKKKKMKFLFEYLLPARDITHDTVSITNYDIQQVLEF